MCYVPFISDWNQTDYTKDITQKDQAKLVLPLVMQYLTPQVSTGFTQELLDEEPGNWKLMPVWPSRM